MFCGKKQCFSVTKEKTYDTIRDCEEDTNVKTERILILAGILVIIALGCLIVYQADVIGVSQSRLEQDAREVQHINAKWDVAQAVNDEMCAMIFYDNEKNKCAYSVYLSGEEYTLGYFYREGGEAPYMEEGVQGLIYEDKGIALMSMNADKVASIVVGDGSREQTIAVDPEQPFAVVLPIESNVITMYDDQGKVVTLYDTFKG